VATAICWFRWVVAAKVNGRGLGAEGKGRKGKGTRREESAPCGFEDHTKSAGQQTTYIHEVDGRDELLREGGGKSIL
jgi:hypothetical protein